MKINNKEMIKSIKQYLIKCGVKPTRENINYILENGGV